MTSLTERPSIATPQAGAPTPPSADRLSVAVASPPPVTLQSSWPDEDYRGWASL